MHVKRFYLLPDIAKDATLGVIIMVCRGTIVAAAPAILTAAFLSIALCFRFAYLQGVALGTGEAETVNYLTKYVTVTNFQAFPPLFPSLAGSAVSERSFSSTQLCIATWHCYYH